MCGICGVVAESSSAIEPAVRRMMRAMTHRGPDDEGYEALPLNDGVQAGFGFRRLSILDLSPAGHQPMFNPATGDCLIFNGEIYNYRALRSRLENAGVTLQSTGDTEVLLKCLSLWGDRVLLEVDGMFAIAFYEARSRRILFARDHLGIKPLYVARLQGRVVFGSEVRTVLASGLVPEDLDAAGIAGFLAYGSPRDPHTVHAHIKSLPAGSFEWIDSRSLDAPSSAPNVYWRFPSPAEPRGRDVEIERTTRDLLDQTVADQCVADVQVGTFLSGGIDSGMLTALAKRHCTDVRSFCVGFEGTNASDETAAAAETAAALGTRHYQTVLDEDWMLLQWREWLLAADRPSIDGLNTYVVSGAINEGGATVALSGVGADELFGGYPHFWKIPKMYPLLAPFTIFPKAVRRAAGGLLFAPLEPYQRARACDIAETCNSPVDLLLQMRRVFPNSDLAALGLSAPALGLTESWLDPTVYASVARNPGDTFHAISRAECLLYMQNTLLRDVDANSMAHSLEVRVPFLGRRFVELVASLPGSVHAPSAAMPKRLLRGVARDILPAAVLQRPKLGFTLPIGDWMFGKLRDQCEAAIDAANECPVFAPGAVRRLWEHLVLNRHRLYWSRALGLVVLGSYLQQVRSRMAMTRAAAASGSP